MANPAVMMELKVFMMSSTLWIKKFASKESLEF